MPARPARLSIAICLVVLAAATAHAAFVVGENKRTLQAGGLERQYNVHVPPGWTGATPVPLVVDIHGLGSNASQQEGISGMKGVSNENGRIVPCSCTKSAVSMASQRSTIAAARRSVARASAFSSSVNVRTRNARISSISVES